MRAEADKRCLSAFLKYFDKNNYMRQPWLTGGKWVFMLFWPFEAGKVGFRAFFKGFMCKKGVEIEELAYEEKGYLAQVYQHDLMSFDP